MGDPAAARRAKGPWCLESRGGSAADCQIRNEGADLRKGYPTRTNKHGPLPHSPIKDEVGVVNTDESRRQPREKRHDSKDTKDLGHS